MAETWHSRWKRLCAARSSFHGVASLFVCILHTESTTKAPVTPAFSLTPLILLAGYSAKNLTMLKHNLCREPLMPGWYVLLGSDKQTQVALPLLLSLNLPGQNRRREGCHEGVRRWKGECEMAACRWHATCHFGTTAEVGHGGRRQAAT